MKLDLVEGRNVEFKTIVNDSAVKTVAAFANSDGDSFERRESLEQNLTFEFASCKFADRGLALDDGAMRTMGLVGECGFTNLALLLSDQCPSFLKVAAFDDDRRDVFLEREEYQGSLLVRVSRGAQPLQNALRRLRARRFRRLSLGGLARGARQRRRPSRLRSFWADARECYAIASGNCHAGRSRAGHFLRRPER